MRAPSLALQQPSGAPSGIPVPLLSISTARPEARMRMRDFSSSHIRDPNTRRAYREAVRQFSAFCAEHGILDLAQVEPVHVAAFVETQLKARSKPTVKLRLAALRMLFNLMVLGGGRWRRGSKPRLVAIHSGRRATQPISRMAAGW